MQIMKKILRKIGIYALIVVGVLLAAALTLFLWVKFYESLRWLSEKL